MNRKCKGKARLSAAVTARNEGSIRVLTATDSSLGILDAASADTAVLSLVTPVEDPVVRVFLQLITGWRGAGVSAAGTVRSAGIIIVLVISLENGEGLGSGDTSVVGALGGLDGGRDLRGYWLRGIST